MGNLVVRKLHQRVQTCFYTYVHHRVDDDVLFMNWSYEETPPMAIPLGPSDEPNRYPIQLYHATATQNDGITGRRVLEVGCGRGGGASYLTRTLEPASYIGLDLNRSGIAFCERRHQIPKLRFIQGNAENLPFPNETFDAVINIESSHCYPHFDRFLNEVHRVLRRDGAFLYADVRTQGELPRWEDELNSAPLRTVSSRTIDTEVLRGMELNSAAMERAMESLVPTFLHRRARNGAPATGSEIHRQLKSGRQTYRMYHLAR